MTRGGYRIGSGRKKGSIPWNKGLKGYNQGHPNYRLNPPWNKGKGTKSSKNELLRKNKEFMIWRRAVFERDNYTCQRCGLRSKAGQRIIIHPHHIKELAKFPEFAFEINNGITLCSECHQEIHWKTKLLLTNQTAQKLNELIQPGV